MGASWILTQSGEPFDLLVPEADMVMLETSPMHCRTSANWLVTRRPAKALANTAYWPATWCRRRTRFTRYCMVLPMPMSATC